MPRLGSSSPASGGQRREQPPRPLDSSFLAEMAKQERLVRGKELPEAGRPLWEQPAEEAQEYWLDVESILAGSETVEQPADQLLYVSPDGKMIVGHETAQGEGRVRMMDAEDVPAEAKAIRTIDQLTQGYERMVDTVLKAAGGDEDFSKEQLMGMRESLIVEASLSEEPKKELMQLLRTMSRAEGREQEATLLGRQAELRETETALAATSDANERQQLRNKVHALRKELYQLRREINPRAAKDELLKILEDTGEGLEPIWRSREEPTKAAVEDRIDQIREMMAEIDKKKEFRALDELKWYAYKKELQEFEFVLKAMEFREAHPQLYSTDFDVMDERHPWDQRLFAIGKEISRREAPRADEGVRDTSVYRMLRDVYLDPSSEIPAVSVMESILKSSTAPEALKEAARAMKEDVRERRLPAPEQLRKKRMEERKARQEAAAEERRANAEKARLAREAKRQSPLEKAMLYYNHGRSRERIDFLKEELDMSEDELLAINKTFKTLRSIGKKVPGMFSEQAFSWSEFVNAPPKGKQKERKPGFFAKLFGLKPRKVKRAGFFSKRRRMMRKIKRQFKRMPRNRRQQVVMTLERQKANVFELKV